MPIGLEDDFKGLIDLVNMKAYYFHGSSGSVYQPMSDAPFAYLLLYFKFIFQLCSEKVATEEIPADLEDLALEKRRELIEVVSEVDDKLAEVFLSDEPISAADLEVIMMTLPHFVRFT